MFENIWQEQQELDVRYKDFALSKPRHMHDKAKRQKENRAGSCPQTRTEGS